MFRTTIAAREHVNLMVGLTGPSGAGKTYSALQLAYGIAKDWTKIVVVDTENRSALYYAGDRTGPWRHIDFSPHMPNGYHPDNWLKLFDFIEGEMPEIEVVVLDSISHEWTGAGGCIELHAKMGGRFDTWAKVTPLHNRFLDRMRHAKFHLIATMRSKQDYNVEENDKGKKAPVKIGLASIQREGTDYEFGVIFDINMGHLASTSKDRTGLFANRGPFLIGPDTGKELLQWARPARPVFDPNDADQKEKLLAFLKSQGDEELLGPVVEQLKGKEFVPKTVKDILTAIRLEG